MRKLSLILFAICLFAISIPAEETEELQLPKYLQGLGVAAGHYSGVGMSYKMIYNGKLGVQLTAGYYADDEYRWAMPGIEFQYHLSRHKNTSFFVSTGLSYEYDRDIYWYWYEVDDPIDPWYYEETIQTTETWTAGAGFGMEAIFFDRISATVETIFYYRDNDLASIMVQGALHYYFNMDSAKSRERKAQASR